MNEAPTWVTACIPTFRCTEHVRQAVKSLLNQTHPFLRVIVINDGDSEPPWATLSDIADPRLVRFDIYENRGPYFALAVASEATPDPLFLIQDADDLSSPERVATLLRMLRRDGSTYAFSALTQFYEDAGGVVVSSPLFSTPPDTVPSPSFKYRFSHHGLYKTSAIRQLGGYFGGFRFGYDKFITNLLLLAGSVSWTPQPLYWLRTRPNSLTRAPDTGLLSERRRALNAEMSQMFSHAYCDYRAFASGQISGRRLLQLIRSRVQERCGLADRQRIQAHAAKLRQGLRMQSGLGENGVRPSPINHPAMNNSRLESGVIPP